MTKLGEAVLWVGMLAETPCVPAHGTAQKCAEKMRMDMGWRAGELKTPLAVLS